MASPNDPHAETNCECFQLYRHAWRELGYRKDGQKRKRNQHPTACTVCGHELAPGDGTIQYNEKRQRWSAVCAPPT